MHPSSRERLKHKRARKKNCSVTAHELASPARRKWRTENDKNLFREIWLLWPSAPRTYYMAYIGNLWFARTHKLRHSPRLKELICTGAVNRARNKTQSRSCVVVFTRIKFESIKPSELVLLLSRGCKRGSARHRKWWMHKDAEMISLCSSLFDWQLILGSRHFFSASELFFLANIAIKFLLKNGFSGAV